MANTQSYDLDRLKAIPFGAVVDKFDTLKKHGISKVTYCPWHEDHKPSLSINDRNGNNYCHCFACGKGGSTIDYVMQHQNIDFRQACQILSTEFGIPTTNGSTSHRPLIRRRIHNNPEAALKRDYTYIPFDTVSKMESTESSFLKCMNQLFHHEVVEYIAAEYHLGNYESWKYPDCTAFPSIDRWGKVHNIKIQHYCTNPSDSQFFHCDDHRHILWLGTMMVKEGLLPKDATFDNTCLFGEHLLNQHPTAKVILVESPKNALVGAAQYPEYVWVATGDKGKLTREILKPLQNRNVTVYPDCDAFEEWKDILMKNNDIADYQISTFLLSENHQQNAKFDIADYIIQQKQSRRS